MTATGADDADTATPQSGQIVIEYQELGEQWTIDITALTIDLPTVAVVLSLDQSGSMTANAGGRTRVQVLRDAATRFIHIMPEENGIGIVSFDTNAETEMEIERVGDDVPGTGKTNAKQSITNHEPVQDLFAPPGDDTVPGYTSIGDGLEEARKVLAMPDAATYEDRAIVVFTDGEENRPTYIDDLTDSPLDSRVFAIGLGSRSELGSSIDKLESLTGDQEGYTLVTGTFGDDDYFLLDKYFLQVFAGVTNRDIVLDPEGRIASPGQGQTRRTLRIPFELTEADYSSDVLLLVPMADAIGLSLETPAGDLIEPGTISGSSGVKYSEGNGVTSYRLSLPSTFNDEQAHAGTWYAVLELDEKRFVNYINGLEERLEEVKSRIDQLREEEDNEALTAAIHESEYVGDTLTEAQSIGIRYNLVVHAQSNLRLRAELLQNDREAGPEMTIRARLTESEIPLANRATIQAAIKRPDGTKTILALSEIEAGIFEGTIAASTRGVYRVRIIAEGLTRRNQSFTREHLLSGAVAHPSDDSSDRETIVTRDPVSRERFCEFAECLLEGDTMREFLERQEIDPDELTECIERYCE